MQDLLLDLVRSYPTSACSPEDRAILAELGREDFAEAVASHLDAPYLAEEASQEMQDAGEKIDAINAEIEELHSLVASFLEGYPGASEGWNQLLTAVGDAKRAKRRLAAAPPVAVPPVSKKRGRPLGSKNRPKGAK